MWRVIAVGLLALCAVSWLPDVAAAKDKVINVDQEDAAMNAAIAKARASIDTFWKQHKKADPGVQNLALKVRISDGVSVEYFWLVDIERSAASLAGVINNDPNLVTNVTLGQRYTFKEAEISDWSFMRNGKIVGNETLRVLLDMMPPEEAATYRAMLETP